MNYDSPEYALAMRKQDEIEILHARIAMLRAGDTCARQCEGQAYRYEAQQQKRRAEMAEQALAGLLDIVIGVPLEVRTMEHFKKLEAWRDKYKKSLQ